MIAILQRFTAWPVTILRLLQELWRKLWIRVILMGTLGLVALGLAQLLTLWVPAEMLSTVPGAAADRLLSIIANAMLAVTTFSLTVMVTVYRSSSSQFTPRLHRLIVQDPTTQNTLATFIGAYVYALVAIVLRELGIFGDDKSLLLFVMTVLVLVLVVYSVIRWVLHLQLLGSLTDTTRQIEDITLRQFNDRLANTCLGAHAYNDDSVPSDAQAVLARATGYVQLFYQEALHQKAEELDCDIHICVEVGHFAVKGTPLAYVAGLPKDALPDDQSLSDIIHAHIKCGDMRTYDQDPRFGLMVMGEIASKALSPGINDPGTAIDVITRVTRILSEFHDETEGADDVQLDRLWIRPLDPDDLFEDGFGALARDGAALVEVQQRLQSSLAHLMEHDSPRLAAAARRAAEREFARALQALEFEPDRARLRAAAHPEIAEAAD